MAATPGAKIRSKKVLLLQKYCKTSNITTQSMQIEIKITENFPDLYMSFLRVPF